MTKSHSVSSAAELAHLRERLRETAGLALRELRSLLDDPHWIARLKYERMGFDPLDAEDRQNFGEQLDQHATHAVALDALEDLMARFPGRVWTLAAGARGKGHDIVSQDGEVAAEVFAAVASTNNGKLQKDVRKVGAFSGPHRLVYFRARGEAPRRETRDGVQIVCLGPPDGLV